MSLTPQQINEYKARTINDYPIDERTINYEDFFKQQNAFIHSLPGYYHFVSGYFLIRSLPSIDLNYKRKTSYSGRLLFVASVQASSFQALMKTP